MRVVSPAWGKGLADFSWAPAGRADAPESPSNGTFPLRHPHLQATPTPSPLLQPNCLIGVSLHHCFLQAPLGKEGREEFRRWGSASPGVSPSGPQGDLGGWEGWGRPAAGRQQPGLRREGPPGEGGPREATARSSGGACSDRIPYTGVVPRPEQQRQQQQRMRGHYLFEPRRKAGTGQLFRSAGQEVARTSGRLPGGARAGGAPPTPPLPRTGPPSPLPAAARAPGLSLPPAAPSLRPASSSGPSAAPGGGARKLRPEPLGLAQCPQGAGASACRAALPPPPPAIQSRPIPARGCARSRLGQASRPPAERTTTPGKGSAGC